MKPFNDYGTYLRNLFGESVHKVSINPGYSCPNRDGTKAKKGCTYCSPEALKPMYYENGQSITRQLETGISFLRGRKKATKFLAYFQSYTNTHSNLTRLYNDYDEALRYPGIAGLVIGTRPDCISPSIAEYLQNLARRFYISVELGIESTEDDTLNKVNRCHTYTDTVAATKLLSHRNIHVCGHLILGFPWESRNTMLIHADRLSLLPLQSLKLHHLQILKRTPLAKEYRRNPFPLLHPESYQQLVKEFLERCRPDLVFQRFIAESPTSLLVGPDWNGLRNYQFTDMLRRNMNEEKTFQGKYFQAKPLTSAIHHE